MSRSPLGEAAKAVGEGASKTGDATVEGYKFWAGGEITKPIEAIMAVGSVGLEGVLSFFGKERLTAEQTKNIVRFADKLPANAKDSVILRSLPNDGVAAQAVSPGRVLGSSATYEKQIDSAGKTIQYTKTTRTPNGEIAHVKDKIGGGTLP
jgi:hypothetical protein